MEVFLSTLNQMLFLFGCILIGFYIKKKGLLPDDAASVISKLESYVIVPALLINSFSTNCSLQNLISNFDLILYGTAFTVGQIIIAYLILPLFKPKKKETGIFIYSLSIVNFAFMGNSLVQSLYGDEMLFKYLMFTLPLNVVIFSIGFVWLTAGTEKFTMKKLMNPTLVSMVIGMFIGVMGIQLPTFARNALSSLAGCFSPLGMILTGLVIGNYQISKLLKNKRVYFVTAIRCVLLPLIILGGCKFIGLNQEILTLLIFITAMPLGLNTIVFPAAYGGDTTLGASMAVISNVLGVILVPLFITLFV